MNFYILTFVFVLASKIDPSKVFHDYINTLCVCVCYIYIYIYVYYKL